MALIDRKRLQKGAAASLLAVVVRILLQFLQVPILYANWPPTQASAWLLIWTLPSYMALTVGAFSTAGSNQTVAAGRIGDIAEARAAYRATQLAIWGSAAVLIGGVTIGFLTLIDLSQWGIDRQTASITLLSVGAYALVMIYTSGLQTAYRYGHDYGGFGYLESFIAASELVITLVAVSLTQTLWVLPATLAVFRLFALWVIAVLARRRWPEIFVAAEPARVRAALRRMLLPFLGFMTAPLLLAINVNGYSLLISNRFGPVVFATFVTIRTLVRLADNGVNLAYSLLSIELSYSGKELEKDGIVRLLSGVAFAGFCGAIAYASLLYLYGEVIHRAWTSGKAGYNGNLVLVFGACVVLRAMFAPFAALLASRNAHAASNFIYLLLTTGTFLISLVAASLGASLVAIAAWQIAAEAVQLACVYFFCARQFQYPFIGFLVHVCKVSPAAAFGLGRSIFRK